MHRRRKIITIKNDNGTIVPPTNLEYNQVFALTSIVPGYLGGLIRLYNGVSTVTYGYIDVGIVNDFLDSGNGTNEILECFDQKGGQSWLFNSGTAPSLFLESDGSYSMKFTTSQGSNNGIVFIGNMINIVYTANGNHVLFHESLYRYFACAHSSSSALTNSSTGLSYLFNGNTSVTNSRANLYSSVASGFRSINYRNINFSSYEWKIARYPYSAWYFSGRIKEIFTRTMTSTTDDNNVIQQSINRNNL